MTLHIGIAGPIATEHLAEHLGDGGAGLPAGYAGAPLMGVLIGELLRRGHRVSAFTTASSLPPDSETVVASGDNLTVYYCPSRAHGWRFNGRYLGCAFDGFARERARLAEAMRQAAPDLIHVHWTYEFALAALDTGLPCLITCHDDPWAVLRFTRSPYRAIRYLMARQVFKRARNLTTVSDYMVAALKKHTRAPIAVVPNPLAEYALALGHARTLPANRRIGMICNGWDRRKNPKSALRAFALYRQTCPEAELHLFGGPFGEGAIAQRWAHGQGLDVGVYFHGARPHRELIATLDTLDALLHPALEESFGVVVAEAMALGLPVVAGEWSGAVPWIVRDVTGPSSAEPLPGVLTNVSSPRAIATALEDVFSASYAKRSQAGSQRATTFSVAKVVEAYLAHYRQILACARPASDERACIANGAST